ncbi:hypothetical protein COT72_03475 [archaeon CG10_big_fil_rev_8_21_14_0_10_43_11]|nr:MAG: hypothetical protein COT72_03475 [archaeon CG10_big_fil_rev_8_21_14_0_10_43_11]
MKRIDGSKFEGGGSLLRLATSISAAIGKPIEVYHIRKNRTPSGLKMQHLHALKALSTFCNGTLKGATIGSERIRFYPGRTFEKNISVRIPTAGATTLVLQNLVPTAVLAHKPVQINVYGGTHVAWSPPAEYFEHVFCDFMKNIGCDLQFRLHEYGFYPKGGGHVSLAITKTNLQPFLFVETGALKGIDAHSIATTHLKQADVAKRQLEAFKKEFTDQTITGTAQYVQSMSAGSNIHAHAYYEHAKIGVEVLGKKGVRAEQVGKQCAQKLHAELASKAPVDEHMADQLIPFMTPGSRFRTSRISLHTKTNLWVCEQLLNYQYVVKGTEIVCKKQ